MIVRIVDALVFEVQVLDLVEREVDDFDYEVALQGEARVVGHRPVIVELDEQLVVLETLHHSFYHRKVIRTRYVVFKPIQHHVFHEVQL